MKKQSTILILLLLFLASSANAHRLNEYLQATTILLGRNSVMLRVTLTPGSDIAQKILMDIDRNGDGIISGKEQQAYTVFFLQGLSVNIDDRPVLLHLLSWNFPTAEAIKKGMGDIQLFLTAAMANSSSKHQLIFKNNGQGSTAIYLVNCLMPEDPNIRITTQSRNNDQSYYTLDFTTVNPPRSIAADQKKLLAKTYNFAVIKTCFFHGVHHILTGYDHLLFLCALVLGAGSLWNLVKVVTAFTIAHSITLTLAAFGLAHVPGFIVEPFIAASIVYVAVQNIFWSEYTNGTGRLCAAFIFGLFHGLGFAGGLLELMHAMPSGLVLYAIVGFSIGVEAGNQLVLLPLYGILQGVKHVHTKSFKPKRGGTFQLFASAVVAITGVYYLFISLTFLAG